MARGGNGSGGAAARVALVVGIIIALAGGMAGRARACTDYDNYQQWLATLEYDQGPQDVASDGDFAFMAVGGGLLQVMDLSSLGAPELVGETTLGSGGVVTLASRATCWVLRFLWSVASSGFISST